VKIETEVVTDLNNNMYFASVVLSAASELQQKNVEIDAQACDCMARAAPESAGLCNTRCLVRGGTHGRGFAKLRGKR
jgi:hypothetical protein